MEFPVEGIAMSAFMSIVFMLTAIEIKREYLMLRVVCILGAILWIAPLVLYLWQIFFG